MEVQYILLKLRWFKSQEGTLGCLFHCNISMFSLLRLVRFCNNIQRAYEELAGSQQGRFAKQLALYVKMLKDNKDIL